MRTIIAGSRGGTHYQNLLDALKEISWTPTVVVSGTARGVDLMGERWAKENNLSIERYPADWDKHGKPAGYVRNVEMADKAEALLALWDGQSRGTMHMINLAKKKGLVVHVWDMEEKLEEAEDWEF